MEAQIKKHEPMYDSAIHYLAYVLHPLTVRMDAILITSTFVGIVTYCINSISLSLAISASFIIIYFILALCDLVSGIVASLYVEKKVFNSSKFIKKFLLVGFCLFTVKIAQSLVDTFSTYAHSDNIILDGVLEVVIMAMHVIKIALLLGFIIYELTSLRENFLRLEMNEFVKVVDILIAPIKKVNRFMDKRFDAVVEEKQK